MSEWQNVIFAVSFVIGLIYALVYAFMGMGEEFGADVDHDVDHDFDHDADHDAEHDHDTDHDVGHNEGFFSNILSFLGVGRCPLSIILIILTMSWGFIGLSSNAFFAKARIIPGNFYFWLSLAIATFLGLFVTRFISSFVAKIIPRMGTNAVGINSLIGRVGEARTTINELGGTAKVLDQYGTIHNVYCKTRDEETIKPNGTVLVLQLEGKGGIFIVTKKPELPANQ